MSNDYFLLTSLPPLSFDSPPEINLDEFFELLKNNLSPKMLKMADALRGLHDIHNLRALWRGEAFDPWGRLNSKELEEAIIDRPGLPDYVYDYLDEYEKVEDRLKYFPALLAEHFRSATKDLPSCLIRKYVFFERKLRLVLTVLRARKLGRSLAMELQYEDPEDELVAFLLAQEGSGRELEVPEELHEVKAAFDKFSDDPLALQRALDEIRFNYIERLAAKEGPFSPERALAYMGQLMLVQKWFGMDKNKGMEMVKAIVKEAT